MVQSAHCSLESLVLTRTDEVTVLTRNVKVSKPHLPTDLSQNMILHCAGPLCGGVWIYVKGCRAIALKEFYILVCGLPFCRGP